MNPGEIFAPLNRDLSRKDYFGWGLILITLKTLLDQFIAFIYLRNYSSIWTYLLNEDLPFSRYYFIGDTYGATLGLLKDPASRNFYLLLLAAALPFMAAGLALTLRRLRSLGLHPWLLIFFFVPYVQWLFFLSLAVFGPDHSAKSKALKGDWLSASLQRSPFSSALTAVLLATGFGLLTVFISVEFFRSYGGFLFVGLPFVLGFVATCLYDPRRPLGYREALWVGQKAVLLVGLGLLAFAMEGVICLLMATPLAMLLAWGGSSLAWAATAKRRRQSWAAAALILLLPALMGFEKAQEPEPTVFRVESQVLVQAPPQKVWDLVTAFPSLDPPKELLFRLGVAYPTHASIQGRGVGARRECHFSTGNFVEPISTWDEPRHLAFDVTAQPQPMFELSPYKQVHAPHLEQFLVSKHGEFRLEAQADGSTLLKGSTWYCHSMGPEPYWRLWSDHFIHKIHLRVLNHIKTLAEKKPA